MQPPHLQDIPDKDMTRLIVLCGSEQVFFFVALTGIGMAPSQNVDLDPSYSSIHEL